MGREVPHFFSKITSFPPKNDIKKEEWHNYTSGSTDHCVFNGSGIKCFLVYHTPSKTKSLSRNYFIPIFHMPENVHYCEHCRQETIYFSKSEEYHGSNFSKSLIELVDVELNLRLKIPEKIRVLNKTPQYSHFELTRLPTYKCIFFEQVIRF